jgi:23S rRNA (cytosine1962-C5)-methyltransferase
MALPPPPPRQPPHGFSRTQRPAGSPAPRTGDDPGTMQGRMTAISHTGPLPWVQLRNALFHPSIFRKMIGRIDPRARNGDLVAVYDRDGVRFGSGMLSLDAPIGLRMLTFDDRPVAEAIVPERLAEAMRLRRDTLQLEQVTDAYRVVHAEGDGLPGLIVDRYGSYAVVELFSFPMWRRTEALREELKMLLNVKDVLVRADARVQEAERFAREADAPQGPLEERAPDRKSTIITENGVRFQIDLTHGHKTGFFCDQRENRLALTHFTPGMRVLDLCAYSGGFGVYAASLGKAAGVTCVDLDEDAIALAQRNANLNKVPRGLLETVHTDAFPYLRQAQAGGRTFDVVVLDPPKLIATPEDRDEGRMKYFDLNRLAMLAVKPGGLLVTCSCSGLFSPEDFVAVLRGAARGARRRVQMLRLTGAGPDHPVMTDCPESAYLKCVWAKVW